MCVVSARLTGVSLSVGRNPSSHLSWLCFSGFSDWFVLHILPSRFSTIWKNHISRIYFIADALFFRLEMRYFPKELYQNRNPLSMKSVDNQIPLILLCLSNQYVKVENGKQEKTRALGCLSNQPVNVGNDKQNWSEQ